MSSRSINNAGRVENVNLGDNFGIINQGAGSIDASAHWYHARIGQQNITIAGNQYQFLNVRLAEATQLDLLILSPFRAVVDQGILQATLAKGHFLIVVDGLDECGDKQGVEAFINHMLKFFEEHPNIPLRIFIASRVEQHIRERLETDGVLLGNLDSHSPHKDIGRFLQTSFQTIAMQDRVIKAYVRTRGSWPTKLDMDKLIKHINGSFILASTIFKYVVQLPTQKNPATPMERLPLTLKMNGLDGLYAQELARSEHLPHFRNIISTIALLFKPLAIVGIAELLGIEAFEVIRVLLNLQAIVHVPGTDEEGKVTLCHTSLRDFLATESRSKTFFVPPSFHLHLSYYCFTSSIQSGNGQAYDYGRSRFDDHWHSFLDSEACDFINEIERLKAFQPLVFDKLPYHAFLCSMFFYSLPVTSRSVNGKSYLLTECAKQLALAAEYPDRCTRLWLDDDLRYAVYTPSHIVQFTQHTYEGLQQSLQRASTAIHANFPEILERQLSSTGAEKEFAIATTSYSGIDIFNALNWIVARARFKWAELKITPLPPLELSFSVNWGPNQLSASFG
ncbi:hypothetical protein EST38_g13969 [Candolleomyces aberdarensis]|uniref:Nephrocystin 3-like N-terminal domain-containing protein n=1 Tax=Candolleomyces aberdarensis TaxID=2316362 RepID=A0A4Q2D0D5_9AGAR|nr:hypothetical protein EST38_g13969 [Candolleomyces aberdarensis]